ncbi:hypothetical protein BpHYR1_021189 [Brachionus plicatilis]|uniref:Uncharacterized protein n=1 Tax=Brachionus plicatilis TaxID=10195 RepID=A0A3M7TAI8_BRAPC|nr:hypothetical protein BpHYR1_021189 [Brachionus plicatilis]
MVCLDKCDHFSSHLCLLESSSSSKTWLDSTTWTKLDLIVRELSRVYSITQRMRNLAWKYMGSNMDSFFYELGIVAVFVWIKLTFNIFKIRLLNFKARSEVRQIKKPFFRIFCSTSFSEKLARTFLTVKLNLNKSICAERFEIVLNVLLKINLKFINWHSN